MPKIWGSTKKGNGKHRLAANGNKLPDPIHCGEVLTDVLERKWKIGNSIGLGGFGEIYLASEASKKKTGPDAKFVIKIEHHSNGPLFTEMHFYHRVGKSHKINEWKEKKKMSFLGMPRFIGSGSHVYKGVKYRFMVIERFGDDLQKLLNRNRKMFPVKTVYTIGKIIIDILEYIHSYGYIHADVKASNLLTGFGPGKENEVYLIDFGLACRYITRGVHKEFEEDLRKAHAGTMEFTSRDAHIGAHSRRGDLEILGYNMLQWLCGRLPWEDHLKDPECVSRQKNMYLSNVSSLIKNCFPASVPPRGITEYFSYVARLKFDEEPNYKHCKDILSIGIKSCGLKDDGHIDYVSNYASLKRKGVKRPLIRISHSSSPPNKLKKTSQSIPTLMESNDLSSPPPRKIRRVASATTSVQASKSDHSSSDKSFCALDNPTPAMLLVMQRHIERKLQQNNGFSKKLLTRERTSARSCKVTPHVKNSNCRFMKSARAGVKNKAANSEIAEVRNKVTTKRAGVKGKVISSRVDVKNKIGTSKRSVVKSIAIPQRADVMSKIGTSLNVRAKTKVTTSKRAGIKTKVASFKKNDIKDSVTSFRKNGIRRKIIGFERNSTKDTLQDTGVISQVMNVELSNGKSCDGGKSRSKRNSAKDVLKKTEIYEIISKDVNGEDTSGKLYHNRIKSKVANIRRGSVTGKGLSVKRNCVKAIEFKRNLAKNVLKDTRTDEIISQVVKGEIPSKSKVTNFRKVSVTDKGLKRNGVKVVDFKRNGVKNILKDTGIDDIISQVVKDEIPSGKPHHNDKSNLANFGKLRIMGKATNLKRNGVKVVDFKRNGVKNILKDTLIDDIISQVVKGEIPSGKQHHNGKSNLANFGKLRVMGKATNLKRNGVKIVEFKRNGVKDILKDPRVDEIISQVTNGNVPSVIKDMKLNEVMSYVLKPRTEVLKCHNMFPDIETSHRDVVKPVKPNQVILRVKTKRTINQKSKGACLKTSRDKYLNMRKTRSSS